MFGVLDVMRSLVSCIVISSGCVVCVSCLQVIQCVCVCLFGLLLRVDTREVLCVCASFFVLVLCCGLAHVHWHQSLAPMSHAHKIVRD